MGILALSSLLSTLENWDLVCVDYILCSAALAGFAGRFIFPTHLFGFSKSLPKMETLMRVDQDEGDEP